MIRQQRNAQNCPSAIRLRIAGVVIACSTPLSGIVAYAIAATLLGEARLEGPQGLTTLGSLTIGVPAVLGLAIILLSYTGWRAPDRRILAATIGTLGATILGVGTLSISTTDSGDASIGGGVLVLIALPLIVGAVYVFSARPGPVAEMPQRNG